ncbi:MAG: 4-alpha-glucanotransferase [Acidimicrobiales bacterium]
MGAAPSPLQRLAALHRVETSYLDAFGHYRAASEETLVGVLQALGEPIESAADALRILDGETNSALAERTKLPVVVVAWEGDLGAVVVGPSDARQGLAVELALEDGGDTEDLVSLEVRGRYTYAIAATRLPLGIHHLAVGTRKASLSNARRPGMSGSVELDEITIISAPVRSSSVGPRAFGIFAPLYALHEGSSGADFGSLERLGRFAAACGAAYVATLPMLSELSRAEDPEGRPSPYSPISRMWWNEAYLDLTRLPELTGCAQVDRLTQGFLPGTAADSAPQSIDLGRRSEAIRPLLATAATRLLESGSGRRRLFEAFLTARPEVMHYARFRAACEKSGPQPAMWPEEWKGGLISDRTVDPEAVRAHAYAQFATDEQLAAAADAMKSAGTGIMLDLPVGCRSEGFDPWAFPDSFALGATIGAPPDHFFSSGQDWGFRPLHPEGERLSGYQVTGGALRHLLVHAAALRLDHAMGLARLWWIPSGLAPSEGAYVRYRSDEMIALCCLEAWRQGACLVGEDLGTVESSLTGALTEHGIAGMHVAIFDAETEQAHPMEPLSPRSGSVALVDTHDTAPFAAWFTGWDLHQRVSLGLLDHDTAESEWSRRLRARRTLLDRLTASELLDEKRADDPVAVHQALATELARSDAGLVIINLEDCWGELDPQNIPGTTVEHENFCRTLALGLDEIERDAKVLRVLRSVQQARLAACGQLVVEQLER